MGLNADITSDVDSIISQAWDIRDGTVVPKPEEVKLNGGGVKLDAVMLYADLADSTRLVLNQDRRVAAKVFKVFLIAAGKLIQANDGYIRSFDGDRIMGVFLGGTKNSNAAKCGMQIKWAFDNIIRPKLLSAYAKIESDGYKLDYSTGIDQSDILVVRGGPYRANDLLFVGRAANVAAKLSAYREEKYKTFISEAVYKMLNETSKLHSKTKADMWVPFTWTEVPGLRTFYKSEVGWVLP